MHLIDVTIVRPTAPTHLHNPRLQDTQRGLAYAAAAERATAKHAKYDALCQERGWTMIPFAVEAHGAVGESARQLLHKLATTVDEMSGVAFLQDADARLSVALQSANAAISRSVVCSVCACISCQRPICRCALAAAARARLPPAVAPLVASHNCTPHL